MFKCFFKYFLLFIFIINIINCQSGKNYLSTDKNIDYFFLRIHVYDVFSDRQINQVKIIINDSLNFNSDDSIFIKNKKLLDTIKIKLLKNKYITRILTKVPIHKNEELFVTLIPKNEYFFNYLKKDVNINRYILKRWESHDLSVFIDPAFSKKEIFKIKMALNNFVSRTNNFFSNYKIIIKNRKFLKKGINIIKKQTETAESESVISDNMGCLTAVKIYINSEDINKNLIEKKIVNYLVNLNISSSLKIKNLKLFFSRSCGTIFHSNSEWGVFSGRIIQHNELIRKYEQINIMSPGKKIIISNKQNIFNIR